MKISVVIPTFNRPHLLRRLLKSIQRQTFRDYEVLVVDDGSEDQAAYAQVIREFRGKMDLRFLRTEGRRGAPRARNLGIRQACYPWIALVDDDDEWLPQKLRRQVEIARKSGVGTVFLYTWAVAKDEKGRILHRYESRVSGEGLSAILADNFVPSSSVLVRKDQLVKAGLFDESLPSCQDWDMWIRVLASGCSCAGVPEVLSIYHKHSVTIGNNPQAYRGYLRMAAKHYPLFLRHSPVTLLKVLWSALKLRFRKMEARPLLAVLTNIIPPYRVALFEALGKSSDLEVWTCAAMEKNRRWQEGRGQGYKVVRLWGPGVGFFDGTDYRFLYLKVSVLPRLLFHRPKVLLIGDASFTSFLAASACLLLRIPYVWWSEVPLDGGRKLMSGLRGFFARHARRVIAASSSAKSYLAALGVPAGRISIIYNTVDNGRYLSEARRLVGRRSGLRTKHGIAKDEPVFLHVGQWVERKRIGLLLEAFTRFRGHQPRSRLVLVGEGPLGNDLRGLALRLGVEGAVIFAGPVEFKELCEWYALSDTLVLIGEKEAWGLVVNEAMCFGLPILVSREAGAKDLVKVGTGMILEKAEVEALARALGRMSRSARRHQVIQKSVTAYGPEWAAAKMIEAVH